MPAAAAGPVLGADRREHAAPVASARPAAGDRRRRRSRHGRGRTGAAARRLDRRPEPAGPAAPKRARQRAQAANATQPGASSTFLHQQQQVAPRQRLVGRALQQPARVEGGDRAHALDLVDLAARAAPAAGRAGRAPGASPSSSSRLGCAKRDMVAGDRRRSGRARRRRACARARGSRRARRCRPASGAIPIAASIRSASAQASPPIGRPSRIVARRACRSSSMIAAPSAPCGQHAPAPARSSGRPALARQPVRGTRSRSSGMRSAGEFGGGARPRRPARAGFSQSRGSSPTATSTPASSHQPSRLAAAARRRSSIVVPAHGHHLSARLTARSRNWQGCRPTKRRARDERKSEPMSDRELMEYDVVIVGAGPAGLAAAIRLKQLAAEQRPRHRRLRARKGQRGRRAHPVGRGDRSARRSTS